MKEYIYKGNLILEDPKRLFTAVVFNDRENQDNVEGYTCDSLEVAMKWLDDNGYSIEEE